MTLTTTHLVQTNKSLNTRLGIELTNARSYESMISGLRDENTVLQLNIADLSHSKDSLVQSLDSTRKVLKIKDKELKMANRVETILTDTIFTILPSTHNCDFNVVLQDNPLTKIEVSRKDTILTVIPTILNSQDIFVYNRKVWRNRGKNFIQRLLTLDFRKDVIKHSVIVNTNPDIKITDSRIIYINE